MHLQPHSRRAQHGRVVHCMQHDRPHRRVQRRCLWHATNSPSLLQAHARPTLQPWCYCPLKRASDPTAHTQRRKCCMCARTCVLAGVYTYGLDGSNECPAGSVPLLTEAACRAAATTLGTCLGSPFLQSDTAVPRGCYAGASAYFNTHAAEAGASGYRLLCALCGSAGCTSAPTGAIHPRDTSHV